MLKSIEFLRKKSRGEVGGGGGLSPLAPVILGPVPRIFWQRVSNLVNKLVLLLHKYRLREDSWDKPKNDWCRGRGFSLVASKQRSVAAGNKVMDTRLPQPAGCGDKYDISGWYWGRLLNAFCTFLKYHSPDAKASPSPAGGEGLHRPWCHKILGTDCASRPWMTGGRGANSFGRSMIEMLGVLAIIAVLSVGGIAGYSKAMEKYKVNKALEEYSFLIYGLLEHMRDIQNLTQENSSKAIGLVTWVKAANLIPQTWTSEVKGTIVDASLQDPYGNDINLYSRSGLLVMDMYLGGYSQNDDGGYFSATFPSKLCSELYRNLAQPLHSALTSVSLTGGIVRYGDAVCDGKTKKCVRDITLAEIDSACKYCKGTFACGLILQF